MAPTDEEEQWLGLVAYPGYEVSSLGRVRSRKRRGTTAYAETPNMLATFIRKRDGYVFLVLRVNGKSRNVLVHKLVLTAFVGPRPESVDGERMEGCHFPDRDRTNNRVGNLRWGTSKENSEDSKIHGTLALCGARGESHHSAKLTDSKVREIIRLHQGGRSARLLAKDFGVAHQTIYRVVERRGWKHVAM